jgi:hypothetical protein
VREELKNYFITALVYYFFYEPFFSFSIDEMPSSSTLPRFPLRISLQGAFFVAASSGGLRGRAYAIMIL